MRLFFIIISFLAFSKTVSGQTNKSACNLNITSVITNLSFGVNVGYILNIKSTSNKSIDAVEWTAQFYDNFGKLIESRPGSFNSTSFIEPILSGTEKVIVRTNKINGATKVFVTINKVHFVDGTICRR
jgi:hypothetical protein